MKLPKNMKYIDCSSIGGPEVLKLKSTAIPKLNDHDVLIKVHASGVNRPDVLQRKGLYIKPKNASNILGLEVSGKIIKKGPKVTSLNINDKVCALTHGGGYAEYCRVHYKHVLKNPKNLSYIESAAIPETLFTVWYNLFDQGKLRKGEVLLIHGGSSGIGTMAIQLAKLQGATVITTVGNNKKVKACKDLGADLVINYKENDFVKKINKFTSMQGVNIILDMIGKQYFLKNIDLLKDRGRLVSIAFLTGNKVNLDLSKILTKRLTITGSTLRPRSVLEKGRIAKKVYEFFWPAFSKKTIKPVIYKTFKLRDANKAHKLMESSKHIGKIMLINI